MSSIKNLVKNSYGFTVAEVLVGIVLFGVLMPATIMAVMNIANLNDRAADLTRVNILAESKLEELRNNGYNSLIEGTYDFTNELDVSIGRPNNATYTITLPEDGIKTVEININYTEYGKNRSLQYVSQISELGVAQ